MPKKKLQPNWYEIPAVKPDSQIPVTLPDVTEKFAPIPEPYNWVIPPQTVKTRG